jgi:hypothetical protein
MRSAVWRTAAALLLVLTGAGETVQGQGAPACARADFEAVVNEAGAALRDLNRRNTPAFQTKLRQLKEKRGWTDDQFLKAAEPFVRDADILAYDQKSEQLLNRITGGGQQGASAGAADCGLLSELRAAMTILVETQKAKWAHMFAKLDKELAK